MLINLIEQDQKLLLPLHADLLNQIQIDDSTLLEVSCDGDAIVIRRATGQIGDAKFRAALDDMNARYGDMLRRLAQ